MTDHVQQAVKLFGGAVTQVPGGIRLADAAALRSPATDRLVRQAVFGGEAEREAARWLLWELGQARGRVPPPSTTCTWPGAAASAAGSPSPPSTSGCWPTTPRAPSSARRWRAGPGPSSSRSPAREIAYTDQRPAEYVAVLIGAALREGYTLPLFIQGDHCQVNAKKYASRPRGGGRRGQEADRRGGRRPGSTTSTWTPPRWWTSPGRPSRSSSAPTSSAAPRSPPSSASGSPRASPCRWAARSARSGTRTARWRSCTPSWTAAAPRSTGSASPRG